MSVPPWVENPELTGPRHVPSKTQLDIINHALSAIQLDLDDVDNQINHLTETRKALMKLQQGYASRLSLIGSLPLEVLARIFIACLPTDKISEPADTRAVPLRLTQVCSEWRALAYATQPLWTSIYLNMDRHQDAERVKRWLDRSGQHPLTLKFTFAEPVDTPNYNTGLVLDMLMAYAPRWETIMCSIDMSWLKIFPSLHGHIPALRALEVIITDCDGTGEIEQFEATNLFRSMSQLRSISIDLTMTSMDFPWSQLEHIKNTRVNTFVFDDILGRATNMTHCSLEEGYSWTNSLAPLSTTPRLHRKLETLRVVASDADFLAHAFAQCTLPKLRKLTVMLIPLGCLPETFIPFIIRSKCRLETLIVEDEIPRTVNTEHGWSRFTSAIMADCLREMPTLVELSAASSKFADTDLLASLTWSPAQPTDETPERLLPKLRKISLQCDDARSSTRIDISCLARMLRSRCTRHIPALLSDGTTVSLQALESVALHFSTDVLPAERDLLEELRSEGLDILIMEHSFNNGGSYTWPSCA
ncbi:hypothetical protein PLICRDRAFT_570039 [Plicaturopsis crispa FD-325 SS-3]|nr:hypothetical protein PLICRDRAFT_570039 [Plicaturopsis crispa FD-325 SS-3]